MKYRVNWYTDHLASFPGQFHFGLGMRPNDIFLPPSTEIVTCTAQLCIDMSHCCWAFDRVFLAQFLTRLWASIGVAHFYSSHPFLCALKDWKITVWCCRLLWTKDVLITRLQRLRVNMVKTKILISAHHEHTFNRGQTPIFFFVFNCLALASSSTTPLQAEQYCHSVILIIW